MSETCGVIVEYVRYLVPEHQIALFHERYAEAGELLTADPHCQDWELRRGEEEPSRHVVRITWDSRDGHEQGFRASDGYQAFLGLLTPFRPYIQEMGHYALVAGHAGLARQ